MKKLSKILPGQDYLTVLILSAAIIGLILVAQPQPKGDGTEYQLVTESLLFDHSLVFTDQTLLRHESYYPDKQGMTEGYQLIAWSDGKNYLLSHSFYYPLFALPIVAITALIWPVMPVLGMYICNVLLMAAATLGTLYYLRRIVRGPMPLFYTGGLIVLSPVIPYVLWSTPETFLYTVMFYYLLCLFVFRKPLIAGTLLGIAVGQSPILFPFALPIFMDQTYRAGTKVTAVMIACFFAMIPYLVSYYIVGTFFPLSSYISVSWQVVRDFLRIFWDPAMGLPWFYPFSLIILFSFRRSLRTGWLLIAGAATLLLGMLNSQFYTAEIGHRYLHYVYPIVLFLFDPKKIKTIFLGGVLIFAAVIAPGMFISQIHERNIIDMSQTYYLPYMAARHFFPYGYREHPEVFINHSHPLDNYWKWRPLAIYFDYTDKNNYFPDTGWFAPDRWVRFIFMGFSPGSVQMSFDRKDQQVKARIGGKLFISREGVLEIRFDPRDILPNEKMANYTYVDIWFSGGVEDSGIKGNRFMTVYAEGHRPYEFTYEK